MNNRASRTYPFPGGIAGKLGDRFEAKWAVKKLIEVILGDAESLQFEFVDPVNSGVEFWVSKNGDKEWFQAKRQNTQGNWTLRRLEQEGVLETAFVKLSTADNDQFYFVSETPSKELSSLARRATTSETNDDFLNCLTEDERNAHLPALNKIWNSTSEQTHLYLQRLNVLVESEINLDTDIRLLGSHAFCDSPSQFFPHLRDYLENNFNRELTTEIVRQEIIGKKVLSSRIPLDPTLLERINQANQRYLESYTPFGADGTIIARSEAAEVLNSLDTDNGPSIILLTGNAGTGKSGVVREVLKGLEERDEIHLTFRVDKYLSIDSPSALGQKLYERLENPVVTLESLAGDGYAVLFIDQIDAISEVSGRAGPIREIVFELIRFVKASRKVRLIAACRTYDLANDRALLELEKEDRVKRIEVKLLDWASEVEPMLLSKDIPIDSVSANQRELLTLPLNLSLFLEVYKDGIHVLNFQSTTDLFDRLVEKKQRDIRLVDSTFALLPCLSGLAATMSQDQSLDAHSNTLSYLPNALDLLATEHLIIRSGDRIAFFHESFFDYAFARGFVAERKNLLDLLKEDEQHLFRRTQVRQILAMYRQVGPSRVYLSQLRNLLTSSDVRYHLKDAVARWLGGLNTPTEAELDIILSSDISSQQMPDLVRTSIYPQSDWLPILIRRSLISQWLSAGNEERRQDALNILRNAVKTFPTEVTQTLRAWWQGEPSRGEVIVGWLSWLPNVNPSTELLELYLDLIRSKPKGLFDNAKVYDHHSLSTWIEHDPDAAGELLRVWFETWYEVFPEGHPFDNDNKRDIDYHWIAELQKKSPSSFLNATIPVFNEALRRINLTFNGKYLTDSTWRYRFGGDGFGSDRFLSLMQKAIVELTEVDPLRANAFLKQIDPMSHSAGLYLWLEAIASDGKNYGHLLPSLLSTPEIFKAGPNGAEWSAFARAANSALPNLTKQKSALVESTILNHWPELNLAKKIAHDLKNGMPEEEPYWTRRSVIWDLNNSGFEQWCIFKSIEGDPLSTTARLRSAQLERKFNGRAIPKPNNVEIHTVSAPIGSERARFMSDSDWLSAICVYREDRDTRKANGGDWLKHTGSRGFAGILRERAKEEPTRFAKLLEQLPLDTPSVYCNEILNGLVEGEADEETFRSVIRYAHDLPGRPCCEGICRLIQKHPNLIVNDDIFEILLWYVENGPVATDDQLDSNRVQELILNADQLMQRGSFTSVYGCYFDRGFAAETLGSILWDCSQRLEEGIRVLNRRIREETFESIRCTLTQPIYSVLHHNNQRAASLLKQLVLGRHNTDLLPLTTHDGTLLLYYVLHGTPDIGCELLELLLGAEDKNQRLLGAFHLFREAFYDDTFAERANELAKQSDEHRKLAANAATNHLAHAAYRIRAERQLTVFFNDPDKEIRAEAAECFRNVREESLETYRELMHSFISSKAFGEENFSFFWLLKDAQEPTTEEVIMAAERIIELTEQPDGTSKQQRPHREMHYLDDLLLREYTATEDQPELRKRILDILDKMLILGLYGTDKIIQEHERA
jgi:tRNA A37 threonylcarbamoyladenosine biosynthesis protein TsaE